MTESTHTQWRSYHFEEGTNAPGSCWLSGRRAAIRWLTSWKGECCSARPSLPWFLMAPKWSRVCGAVQGWGAGGGTMLLLLCCWAAYWLGTQLPTPSSVPPPAHTLPAQNLPYSSPTLHHSSHCPPSVLASLALVAGSTWQVANTPSILGNNFKMAPGSMLGTLFGHLQQQNLCPCCCKC